MELFTAQHVGPPQGNKVHAQLKQGWRLTCEALLQRGRLAIVLQTVEGAKLCRLVGGGRREVAAPAAGRCSEQ